MNLLVLMLEWGISITVFILYYRSSVTKMNKPYLFMRIVADYQIISLSSARVVAPLIAIVELTSAFWTLLPWSRLYGSLLGAALQLLFLIVLTPNLGKEFEKGCGCFELNAPQRISFRHLLLNISVLAGLALVILSELDVI